MKYIRLLFYILFISKTIVTWGGENIGGLSFRAYEYSKDVLASLFQSDIYILNGRKAVT